jgi:penicillin-binding protein 2
MENNLPVLRGIPGYSLIQVDHQGYARKSIIERIEPVNGNHVILTLDSTLQKTAEKLLEGKRGAMVAVDASNGDILAAASAPGYDVGLFMPKISNKDYTALRDAPERPLINRALQGIYPPGSILKPLIMLAYLENGVDPAKEVECNGYSHIYNVRIRCASYRRGGHGMMNMHDALKHSCNAYMIEIAQSIGLSPMQKLIREAGLCRKTGIGLPESAGFFPDNKLKRARSGTKWNMYDTALLSIGQGLIGITPLQAALYCASLANGGTVWKPNLVSKLVDTSGNDLWFRTPKISSRLNVKKESLKKIADGMFDVVNAPGGSGRSGHVEGLEIRGKTGSAEFGQKGNLKIYAWFIAHAVVKGKNIALAVVIEEGASGSKTCAPLAAEFFKASQAR